MYTNLVLDDRQKGILISCLGSSIYRLCKKQMFCKVNGEKYGVDFQPAWDICEKEINTFDEISKLIDKNAGAKDIYKNMVSKLYAERKQIQKEIENLKFEYIHLYQADLITDAEYKRFEDKNKELVIKLEGISRELHTW